ncbi:MAG: mannose-1-phosphate guanylyltransferase/mannose-6-phosphate isomerase [Pseudomonadota bacterium]
MSQYRIQPVIMSGGAGTRLWPLSRQATPKQLLPLVSARTMLQETALRLSGDAYAPPLIICGAAHTEQIREQLWAIDLPPAAIITEPVARNTAAVAAVAAAWAAEHNASAQILLAPADHVISDAPAFRRAVAAGAEAARDGAIVTFGIKADRPHTGYGYIRQGAPLSDAVFKIDAFLEKPDRDTAEKYLGSGEYFWNAGIFLFTAGAMVRELQRFNAPILDFAQRALRSGVCNDGVIALDRSEFAQCPAISIDYAVMEKTDKAAVVAPVDAGWSDIGSWTELPVETTAANGGAVAAIDCAGTTVKTDGIFVGAIGLEDMIVVATKDAILIAPRDRAQDVKQIVDRLKEDGRDDLL